VPPKIPNGKTVEGSHIAAISILKVKIHRIRGNGHIVKRKKKKHKKMSFTDNITKSTTSKRASNISRRRRMRGKDQGTTKTATSISLNKLGSVRNRSQRHTRNMNPMKILCFTI
jgi:DNA-binding GntR family transcriptional regulator